jgi:isocitrate dehydrogenase kinase/phosphatase
MASTATTGCSAKPVARAKHASRQADWHGQQRAQRERIEFYDLRVAEAVAAAASEFKAAELPMDTWQQVKLHYIGLLVDHHQPELAETFFNSVTTKILHRSYFQNDFIFVRPAVSTEYIENDEPAAAHLPRLLPHARTCARPGAHGRPQLRLQREFDDLERDIDAFRAGGAERHVGQVRLRANFQIQVLSSLFFRNKGAYIVGKIINGFAGDAVRAAHPARDRAGSCDRRALFGEDDLLMLFSFARAYFMVDMEIPSGLCAVPAQPDAAQAARRALQRAGPAEAGQEPVLPRLPLPPAPQQRPFRIAPGIKGMVMLVFDLPSSPTCSRSSRTSTRRRRTPRASRSRASTCW